ncbi:MAG: hypothetical protein AB1515_01095 [Nitrospirota bacterium]
MAEAATKQTAGKAVRQVFAIAERNGKSYWIRIGAAFINQDGSETVLLDALPVNGRMQIRAMSDAGKADASNGA